MDEFIQSVAHRTLAATQQLITCQMDKILHEKEKLLNMHDRCPNPWLIDDILKRIGARQVNMIQRAQYNVDQRLKALSHALF